MKEEFYKWYKIMLDELSKNQVTLGDLYKILLQMKEDDLDEDAALSILKEIRAKEGDALTDVQDDLLLDSMDIVTGHCLPEDKIWK